MRRGNEVVLFESNRFVAITAGDGHTTVVCVCSGSLRVALRTGGWLFGWNHLTNIAKKYAIDVQVDLFRVREPKQNTSVIAMYKVMSQMRHETLQAGGDPGWDVRIRGNLNELYWM